jgi:hypothetical protein
MDNKIIIDRNIPGKENINYEINKERSNSNADKKSVKKGSRT